MKMKDKLITLRWFLLTLPMPLFPNASKISTLSHFPAFQGVLLGFNLKTYINLLPYVVNKTKLFNG